MVVNPSTSLSDVTFAVFDVETTGLSPDHGHRMVEIACVRFRDGGVVNEFSTLLDSPEGRAMAPAVVRIHGIHPEMLAGAPTFAQIAPRLSAHLSQAVWVAHNISFDVSFLEKEYRVSGLAMPKNQARVDTLTLARRRNFGRHSLPALAERFGIQYNAHRALGDVQATYQVLQHLIRLGQYRCLGELLAAQGI